MTDPYVLLPTRRQQQLLDCLHLGMSNKQIAASLGLTPGTVKQYLWVMMRQYHVQNRVQLALKTWEAKWRSDM